MTEPAFAPDLLDAVTAPPEPSDAALAELHASTGSLEETADQLIPLIEEAIAARRKALGKIRELAWTVQGEIDWLERTAQRLSDPAGAEAEHALRGRRLADAAVELLEQTGETGPIHYDRWFKLLDRSGRTVGGNDPKATFLTSISRDLRVERVGGRRSGLYRLRTDGGDL